MGKASSRKKEHRERERDRPHLERKLVEQLDLLRHLGVMFDTVSVAASLPIATCLRVLLHNRQTSHALVHQLGLESKLKFRDTALQIDPRNLIITHNGLVLYQVEAGVGGRYVPRCAVGGSFFTNADLPFGQWWAMVVLRDAQGHEWTRRKLVLDLANKEGGAHLDPRQPEAIRELEQNNSMGFVYVDDRGEQPFMNGPLGPSVRQIAHEVEATFKDWKPS